MVQSAIVSDAQDHAGSLAGLKRLLPLLMLATIDQRKAPEGNSVANSRELESSGGTLFG